MCKFVKNNTNDVMLWPPKMSWFLFKSQLMNGIYECEWLVCYLFSFFWTFLATHPGSSTLYTIDWVGSKLDVTRNNFWNDSVTGVFANHSWAFTQFNREIESVVFAQFLCNISARKNLVCEFSLSDKYHVCRAGVDTIQTRAHVLASSSSQTRSGGKRVKHDEHY